MKKITVFVLTAIIGLTLLISYGFEKKYIEIAENTYIQTNNEDDGGFRG